VIIGWSVLLGALTLLQSSLIKRSRWRAARFAPQELLHRPHDWPGFRKAAGAVCVILIVLICLDWVILAASGAAWSRARLALSAAAAAVASLSTFSLTGRRWSENLGEAAMGLMTLAVGAASLLFVPIEPVDAASRYPLVFNALMFAFALMAGYWVWIGRVWTDQLDQGRAWTAAGRIAQKAPGFAFHVATIGLVCGSLMAVWPRLAFIVSPDDALGRFAAGIAGHLLLILVLVRSGRQSRRSGHHALAVLTLVSMVVFVLVRADPLAARVHRGPTAMGPVVDGCDRRSL
jgi:hypothetical protein